MTDAPEALRRTARLAYERVDDARLARACAEILAGHPDDVEARRLLGRAALRDLRPHPAAERLAEVAARAPDTPASWIDLARALLETGRLEEAEAQLDAAASRGVASPRLLSMLGVLRVRLARPELARSAFSAAIDLDPAWGEAYRGLALTDGLRPGDPERARAERVFEKAPDGTAAAIAYALAEAALRAGDEAAFIAQLHIANARQRTAWGERSDGAMGAMRRAARAAKGLGQAARRAPVSELSPVFVMGGAEAGAEDVERALAQAAGAPALGESAYLLAAVRVIEARTGRPAPLGARRLSRDALGRAGAAYAERVGAIAPGAGRVVDRVAAGPRLSGLAAALFPNGAIVRVRRDPIDLGLEIYRRPFASGAPRTCELGAIGRALTETEQLEQRIDRAMPGRIITLDWESVVAEPDAAVARALSEARVPLAARDEPAAAKARAVRCSATLPVAPLPPGSWRRFEADLAPLRDALDQANART